MANVTLTARECRKKLLPSVCMRCGKPAVTTVEKTFLYYPSWLFFLSFWSVWGALVDAVTLSGAMTLDAPVCRRHRTHWATRTRVVAISTMTFVFLFVGVIWYLAAPQVKHDPDSSVDLCTGTLFASVAWFGLVLFFHITVIKAIRITPDLITLTQVHRDFVNALEEKRGVAADDKIPEEWIWDENGPRRVEWVWDESGPRRRRVPKSD
ncbi:hypothetical protein [Zavarzinella formosa]|uniref:hypothetical protein n=1 Tax=Zavarzinella formosa TaxID=360055 RepID=UPI0002DD961E|nr:hypothetical protein [Zavarzinella formosa]